MYRPGSNHPTLSPADHFQQFSAIFRTFFQFLFYSNLISLGTVYLLGDINLDLLKYSKCNQVTSYVDLLFSLGLLQIITKPTRCTPRSATLIDHIITNAINKDYYLTPVGPFPYFSLHYICYSHSTPQFHRISKFLLIKFNQIQWHFTALWLVQRDKFKRHAN